MTLFTVCLAGLTGKKKKRYQFGYSVINISQDGAHWAQFSVLLLSVPSCWLAWKSHHIAHS